LGGGATHVRRGTSGRALKPRKVWHTQKEEPKRSKDGEEEEDKRSSFKGSKNPADWGNRRGGGGREVGGV